MVEKQRFLILQVITPHYHQELALQNMVEAEQLVATYGGSVVEKTVQHRVKPSPDLYIGAGKFAWLKEQVLAQEIDVVVLNDIVNAGQIFRLEKALWAVNPRIAVWDRVDLILNIFDQHASTVTARLQIELARLQHLGPRIYGLGGTVLSRQGGGIGTRGAGETNIEFERRKLKARSQKIRQELKKHVGEVERVMARRRKQGIRSIALVGYTSAGKTTLFNKLSGKQKIADPSLFTTLDTVVGKVKLARYSPTLLISDTIGFIENLPPFLIDAFRSTLMEAVTAQLRLQVVDASDPELPHKIEIVETILKDLGIEEPSVLVFNKMDVVTAKEKKKMAKTYKGVTHFFVSAKTGEGIAEIKQFISEKFGV